MDSPFFLCIQFLTPYICLLRFKITCQAKIYLRALSFIDRFNSGVSVRKNCLHSVLLITQVREILDAYSFATSYLMPFQFELNYNQQIIPQETNRLKLSISSFWSIQISADLPVIPSSQKAFVHLIIPWIGIRIQRCHSVCHLYEWIRIQCCHSVCHLYEWMKSLHLSISVPHHANLCFFYLP